VDGFRGLTAAEPTHLHAVLNTVGAHFFFRMVQGEDQARLGLLMTIVYVLVAAAVLLVDRRRLDRSDRL